MTDSFEIPQLTQLARVDLGQWPTPLQPLPRLSRELGGPNIWVKRDDCTGLATGGNKTRKLEYLLGDAIANGAEQVVTFGALQSNHARQTAAACAQLGLPCYLLLTKQVPSDEPRYESGGNLLLDSILGSHVIKFETHEMSELKSKVAELRAAAKTYVVPAGGSNAVGALGYVQAASELAQQCHDQGITLSQVTHASSSSGTQAGLVAGMQALGLQLEILGINVYHPDPETLRTQVRQLTEETHEKFLLPKNSELEIAINHAYLGEGYGQLNNETRDAIKLTAQTEGLLFDPVYSGKALAALIDQITVGNFAHHDDVILIHTGGVQALNVYENEFLKS
ncbi:MAG: L-cysteate sulfo-lyase [Limisphaerales bacterium]|jgi:L-cysteate sulfo-lyase